MAEEGDAMSEFNKAARIVKGILDTVETSGKFVGRGKDRCLYLGLIVKRDGSEQSVYSRLVEWTLAEMRKP